MFEEHNVCLNQNSESLPNNVTLGKVDSIADLEEILNIVKSYKSRGIEFKDNLNLLVNKLYNYSDIDINAVIGFIRDLSLFAIASVNIYIIIHVCNLISGILGKNNPSILNNPEFNLLIGKVYFAYYEMQMNNEKLFQAIDVLQKAEDLFSALDQPILLQDCLRSLSAALMASYKQSNDPVELSRALSKTKKACDMNNFISVSLCFEYIEILLESANVSGNADFVLSAITTASLSIYRLFNAKLASYSQEYKNMWIYYAKSAKTLFDITHTCDALLDAENVFKNAVLVYPDSHELWFLWGEMNLYAGWIFHDVTFVDKGLEKLAFFKLGNGDPIRVAAYLGWGIAMLGFYLEDINLLMEGHNKIASILTVCPNNTIYLLMSGISNLCLASYFGDEKYFAIAMSYLNKSIEINFLFIMAREMLFELYLAFGSMKNNYALIEKAIASIDFLVRVRGSSCYYYMRYGSALITASKMVSGKNASIKLIEKAISKFQYSQKIKNSSYIMLAIGKAMLMLGEELNEEDLYRQAVNVLTKGFACARPCDRDESMFVLSEALLLLSEASLDFSYLRTALKLASEYSKTMKENEQLCSVLGRIYLSAYMNIPDLIKTRLNYIYSAEKYLMEAIRSGSTTMLFYMACLYAEANMPLKAVCFLKKAIHAHAIPKGIDICINKSFSKIMHYKEVELFFAIYKLFESSI